MKWFKRINLEVLVIWLTCVILAGRGVNNKIGLSHPQIDTLLCVHAVLLFYLFIVGLFWVMNNLDTKITWKILLLFILLVAGSLLAASDMTFEAAPEQPIVTAEETPVVETTAEKPKAPITPGMIALGALFWGTLIAMFMTLPLRGIALRNQDRLDRTNKDQMRFLGTCVMEFLLASFLGAAGAATFAMIKRVPVMDPRIFLLQTMLILTIYEGMALYINTRVFGSKGIYHEWASEKWKGIKEALNPPAG